MSRNRRALTATLVFSVIALIVTACGNAVSENPKAALADAFAQMRTADAAGLTLTFHAPDFDPDAAVQEGLMEPDEAEVVSTVFDDLDLAYSWNNVDTDATVEEQLAEGGADMAVRYDGVNLFRFRVAEERVFVASDVSALVNVMAPYAGPGEDPEAILSELSIVAAQMFGQQGADQVLNGGWVELIDLLSAEDLDLPMDEANEAGQEVMELMGAFAENDLVVEHVESGESDRLRVSASVESLGELAIDIASLQDDMLADLGADAEIPEIPAEWADIDVWAYVELVDGRLSAIDVPLGELLVELGEDVVAAEGGDAEEFASELEDIQATGIDTLSIRVEFDQAAERVSAPADALEFDLQRFLEDMWLMNGV